MRRVFMAVVAAALAGGCGFEPLYAGGHRGGVVAAFQGIEVAPIPERLGQVLRNRLTGGLAPGGNAGPITHRLEVRLEPSVEGFGFRPDEAITRERVRLVAHYRLVDLASNNVVYDDVVRADASIDIVQSDYATLVAEERAAERNAEQVSGLILSRLALYFRARAANRASGQ